MKEKQKLDRRDIYTPTDAPQVRGNCDLALNREETLSVHGSKTLSNNPDVDLRSGMTGRDLRAPVINMHSYGKRAVIRNGEKKMDVSMKRARLVRYGKGLQFQSRFIPALTDGISSGGG